jgi:hypothetical protein
MEREVDMTNAGGNGMIEKYIRAKVIRRYMQEAGYTKAVCFTCGNAAIALRAEGVDTLEIGSKGVLEPKKWWTPAEIHRVFPDYFDATSGHLPAHLMVLIAKELRKAFRVIPWGVYTGSGETITCFRWAFPQQKFEPLGDFTPATERNPESALEWIIDDEQDDGNELFPREGTGVEEK